MQLAATFCTIIKACQHARVHLQCFVKLAQGAQCLGTHGAGTASKGAGSWLV